MATPKSGIPILASTRKVTSSVPKLVPPFLPSVPGELKELNQWLPWRAEGKSLKEGWDIVPYNLQTGEKANLNDPSSWLNLMTALGSLFGEKFTGIGFAVSKNDPYVGFDIDNCVDEAGNIDVAVSKIITDVNSYSEFSPSRKGVQILCKGKLPLGGGRRFNYPKVGMTFKIYDSDRFLALTGNHITGTPLSVNHSQDAITNYHEKTLNMHRKPDSALIRGPEGARLTDDEVISKQINSSIHSLESLVRGSGVKLRNSGSGRLVGSARFTKKRPRALQFTQKENSIVSAVESTVMSLILSKSSEGCLI
jgi:hypothetical protein